MQPDDFVNFLDALRAENAKQQAEIKRLTAQVRIRCDIITQLQAELIRAKMKE